MTTLAKTDMRQSAVKLVTEGFKVIPLCNATADGKCGCGRGHEDKAIGKVPLTDHGLKDCTQTQLGVQQYWAKHPQANIGIVTDGLIVLDFDAGHGGLDSKNELEAKYGPLSRTRTHRTGGGGQHWLYRAPSGVVVRNTTGLAGYQGIDTRANGGYIVAPPSLHPSGNRYEVLDDCDITPAPEWLVTLATQRSTAPLPPRGDIGQVIIPEGQRNAHLTSLAGSMRRRGMPQSAIEVALLAVNNAQCKPPLPDNEVLGIAKSISQYKPAPAADKIFNQTREKQHHMMSLSSWRQAVLADPPRNDLIEDIMPNSPSEYCIICGRAGIGKTNLALGMGFCLATGRPWFSHKTTKCKVGYLAFEGLKAKLLGRVEKLLISYPDAEPNLYIERSLPFKLVNKALDDFKFLIEGLDVIIIDPIREIVPGDYTKPEYASTFISALKTVCNETHTVAILLHHIRKPDKRLTVRPEDLQFEVKGATDYVDAAGTLLLLERARQARKSDGRFGSNLDDRTLHFCKVKDSPSELYPLCLRFNRNTLIFEPHSIAYNDEDYGFNEN